MTGDASFKAGDHVEHRVWGLGKVVASSGDEFYIYFKGKPGAKPEQRTSRLKLPSPHVQHVESRPDEELDNLPPWRDDHFVRYPTAETFEAVKQRFLRKFPNGFSDPGYLRGERAYKEAAHERYTKRGMRGLDSVGESSSHP